MEWKSICDADQIGAGEMQIIETDGARFLVLKGTDDEPLVVPPVCPHMTMDLCDGFFDGEILTCAQHLWQWSAKDGSVHGGIAERPLLVYPSRKINGVLEIQFESELRYGHEPDAEETP